MFGGHFQGLYDSSISLFLLEIALVDSRRTARKVLRWADHWSRIASMIPEEVVQDVLLLRGHLLSSFEKDRYKKVLNGIKSVFKIYHVLLRDLLDALEQSCKDITETADTDLCNSTYNSCCIAKSSNSHYDRLIFQDMSACNFNVK